MLGLKLREGTGDSRIWNDVNTFNEYRLPDRADGWVVLDIGAHCGSFAALCKSRGALEVWGVEIDLDNLRLAMHNVAVTPGNAIFQPFHAAAWRSDRRGVRMSFGGHDGDNTGGAWSVPHAWREGEEVPSIPLDDLLKLCTDFGRRRCDLLKLDCETAEWPILFTSRCLQWVDRVAGEYHAGAFDRFNHEQNIEGVVYSIDALRALLEGAGFLVTIEPPNEQQYNHFWAGRPGLKPEGW